MKEISLEEIKRIQLEMMSRLHSFCEKNGLTYFLTGGTLLGAIRHKGYIPWDDDIDILMPRYDYQVLMDTFNSKVGDENLQVVDIYKDDKYLMPYGKLIRLDTVVKENVASDYISGVWIDIFPLDNMSDEYRTAAALFKNVRKYRNILSVKNIVYDTKRSFGKNVILELGKVLTIPYSRSKVIKKIDSLSRKYENDKMSKYVCVVSVGTYGIKEIVESSNYLDRIDVEFENCVFKAPSGYDKILTHLYGDYMQLPPEEKRVTHHAFQAYWK